MQRFFKLFFSGRKLAFSALEDFGKYSVISYEAACSDVNDGFEQIVEILEPNEQPETIDHSYKKDKSHLNTNQNSRVKMLSWQRELPNSVLLGMKKYFHNAEDFEDYLEMMPELENSGSIISKITKRLFS